MAVEVDPTTWAVDAAECRIEVDRKARTKENRTWLDVTEHRSGSPSGARRLGLESSIARRTLRVFIRLLFSEETRQIYLLELHRGSVRLRLRQVHSAMVVGADVHDVGNRPRPGERTRKSWHRRFCTRTLPMQMRFRLHAIYHLRRIHFLF